MTTKVLVVLALDWTAIAMIGAGFLVTTVRLCVLLKPQSAAKLPEPNTLRALFWGTAIVAIVANVAAKDGTSDLCARANTQEVQQLSSQGFRC